MSGETQPAWLVTAASRLTFRDPGEEFWHWGRLDAGERVGMVLRAPGGEVYLVGDMNTVAGVCDDCTHDARAGLDALPVGWTVAHLRELLAPDAAGTVVR